MIWNRNIEKSKCARTYTPPSSKYLNISTLTVTVMITITTIPVCGFEVPSSKACFSLHLHRPTCYKRVVHNLLYPEGWPRSIFCIHLPNSEKARSDCFERPKSEYKQFWDLNNLYPELDLRLLSTSNVLRSNLCFDCTNFTSKNGDYVVCYRCLVSFQGSRHRGGNIHQLMCSI